MINEINTKPNKAENIMESILTKAQALAREEERKRFLENWFNTQKGVVDTINSANKIFASIDKNL